MASITFGKNKNKLILEVFTMVLLMKLILIFLISVILTPFVIKFAFAIGAVDIPKSRKVHSKIMPRLGGLSIAISVYIGIFLFTPESVYLKGFLIGSFFILITGVFDDLFELNWKWKLSGQVVAALCVVLSGLHLKFIHIPFIGQVNIGWWGIPISFLWILIVTNSINLIDGLDGLAAGVSIIVLSTIVYLSMPGLSFVVQIALITIFATLGFLVFNFYPAKIFMGDTGALFLGFVISLLSLLEFKNVTVFSLLIPALILGVPLSDTFFAIVRRIMNKKSISMADKSHLHHSILKFGFSHLQTVLIIYFISFLFSLAAIVFSRSAMWLSIFIIFLMLFFIEILGEILELHGRNFKPLTNLMKKITYAFKQK